MQRASNRKHSASKKSARRNTSKVPYFARRTLNSDFAAIMHKLRGGTNSTRTISEDRDD
jgi:hypothetical protein